MTPRRVVGCMTGTSLDALDAALVEVRGVGLGMTAAFVRAVTVPLGVLRDPLRTLAEQKPMPAGAIAALALDLGKLHAAAILSLLDGESVDLVCAHGQTVFHRPPVSWQLLNPAPIAGACNAPVVFDLRQADLTAGGQGAPITPIADFILFRHASERRAVVNLGGFCNITLLPADGSSASIDEIEGRDVCACNHVLDEVARTALGAPFDDGGRAALRGTTDPTAIADLGVALLAQSAGGRSLGTGDEVRTWIAAHWRRLHADDLAASACAALAQVIARALDPNFAHAPPSRPLQRALPSPPHRVLLAGGGVRNAALVRALTHALPCPVEPTDRHGIPAPYREAAAFAVLGALCQDRVPITLPGVTECRTPAPVAGVWVKA